MENNTNAIALFTLLRSLRPVIIFASVVILQACSGLPFGPAAGPGEFILRSPASLGRDITAYQNIQVEFEQETFNLQSAVNINHERIQLVLMDSLGQRMATVSYDGRDLGLKNQRWLHTKLPPSYMLETLQMVFWPLKSLQQTSPHEAQWRFEQQENIRKAYYKGKLSTITEYLDPSPWTGKVLHTNTVKNYRLHISTLLLKPLNYQ